MTAVMPALLLGDRMATAGEVRRLALADPRVREADEHGRRSFRIDGRVFASMPDDRTLHVVLGQADALSLSESHPDVCQPLFWEDWVVGLKVTLQAAESAQVGALLDAARARLLRSGTPTAPPDASCPQPPQAPALSREERQRAARASASATFRSVTRRR